MSEDYTLSWLSINLSAYGVVNDADRSYICKVH